VGTCTQDLRILEYERGVGRSLGVREIMLQERTVFLLSICISVMILGDFNLSIATQSPQPLGIPVEVQTCTKFGVKTTDLSAPVALITDRMDEIYSGSETSTRIDHHAESNQHSNSVYKSLKEVLKLCRLGQPEKLFEPLLEEDLNKAEISAMCNCFHSKKGAFTEFLRNNEDAFVWFINRLMTHHDWFKNPRSGWTVALILEMVGKKDVVDPLVVLLQDDDPDARSVAARALGNTGDRKASNHLIPILFGDECD